MCGDGLGTEASHQGQEEWRRLTQLTCGRSHGTEAENQIWGSRGAFGWQTACLSWI